MSITMCMAQKNREKDPLFNIIMKREEGLLLLPTVSDVLACINLDNNVKVIHLRSCAIHVSVIISSHLPRSATLEKLIHFHHKQVVPNHIRSVCIQFSFQVLHEY